jgi:serine/threonine protein kinase
VTRCPFCTEPIPFDAPGGLCPWCLCASVIQPKSGVVSQPLNIAGHRIRGVLGKGTFGVVYLAHHAQLRRDVALKVSKQAFSDAADLARFRHEVQLLTQLDLPHVVRIFDSGLDDGHLYFTMPVMSGGTLRSRMADYREPWSAAGLMVKIARAVHSLHEHPLRVLHLDLKPENILFDHHGTPHISDFGIATVASSNGWTKSTRGIGGPAYVAPEQAFVDQGELGPATDVYSLGAILYELLTGSPPHTGKTLDGVLRRVALEEPVPPRRLVPELDRDLETICLHALGPANTRYASAADLADDLEKAAAHRPIVARRSTRVRHTLRWVRRHPTPSAVLLLTALLGAGVLLLMRSFTQAESERLERAVGTNAFMASAQAGAALYQLTTYASLVRRAANDAAVSALVDNDKSRLPEPPELEHHGGDFDSLLVLDAAGRPRAHWRGRPWDDIEARLPLREHLASARHLAEHCPNQTHLGSAFRSDRSGKLQLGISAPLIDAAGNFGGVLLAFLDASSAFGKVILQDPEREHHSSLLGPRERSRESQPSAGELVFLVHEGLAPEMEHSLRDPSPALLRERFSAGNAACEQLELRKVPPLTVFDYLDPVPGFSGRWLATIAPVGKTEFRVVVQARHPDSVDADAQSPKPVPDVAFRP